MGPAALFIRARIDVRGALIIAAPAVEKGKRALGVFCAILIHKGVQIDFGVTHPGTRARMIFVIAFARQPALRYVISAGVTFELLLVDVVAAQEKRNAIMNSRDAQGDVSGPNANSTATADPITDGDALPFAGMRRMVDGHLQLLMQAAWILMQPPRQVLSR